MLNSQPTATHKLKTTFVAHLKEGQRLSSAFFMVAKAALEPFRNKPGRYLALMLTDKTGQIAAKVWEGGEELAETVKPGAVVKVAGDARPYNSHVEITVQKIRLAESHEYDLRDFLPATDGDVEVMLGVLREAVTKIADRNLYALVRSFYGLPDFEARFAQAPATRRVHHAYLGGLLEQTVEMLQLADIVLWVYPQIDRDLLRAGILLAQIGKARDAQREWRTALDKTDEGELLGPILLSAEMVALAIAAIPDFPAAQGLRVRHMIAALNGEYEHASPRRPMTLEAIALHYLFEMTGQINFFAGLIAAKPEGEAWTARDGLLGRALFAPAMPAPATASDAETDDDGGEPLAFVTEPGEAIGEEAFA